MKSLHKYLVFLLIAIVGYGITTSCSDDELENGGTPLVSYVRITDPVSSDSLLVSAFQGQMIAIMGKNLGGVRQVWFNDQRAELTPTLITDHSIITRVPNQIPAEITNKMKLIFANGSELIHDFSVDISEPLMERMANEYLNPGDTAVIHGNYFYEPVMVTFTGGAQAELITVEDELLEFKVPDGAQPGPVTVTTNFGATESDFWFRDDRNIIASFNFATPPNLWHGKDYIVQSDPKIPPIAGKFIRMKQEMGNGAWFELYVGDPGSDSAPELANIPEAAILSPENYIFKFEINTLKPLTGAAIHLYLGPTLEPLRHSAKYIWRPNLHTNGEWQTVSISWKDIKDANTSLVYNPNGYGISLHFSGGSPFSADFALDNLRVVPITNDN
jgi:hypothetical protein